MKKEIIKEKKFNLDKFEVAKLSSMNKIKGGGDTVMITGTDHNRTSSRACVTTPADTVVDDTTTD